MISQTAIYSLTMLTAHFYGGPGVASEHRTITVFVQITSGGFGANINTRVTGSGK